MGIDIETGSEQADNNPSTWPSYRRNPAECTVAECTKKPVSRGLCPKHWNRWRKNGDPLAVRLDFSRTVEERFWAKVDKNGPVPDYAPHLGPCWVWTAAKMSGYGAFFLDGRNVYAHVVSYTWEYGEIPKWKERDHLCRVRACVRPSHLEAVTHWVNVARGTSPHGVNAAKDRCRNGHLFTDENTRINSQGARVCVECARDACRRWWLESRSAKKAG
jgi:hypothetical protein